ncbi:hypothetical protein A7A78_14005 [Aequorivita soesokkakensis]|jgi:hypothetical protein|uniref:Uncharacterized protein n=1 Tax=Aequorivita soesokkakensis TaxID=1385699 RepID=A0A1A9LC23_9FLAO|nr:hypothetical protein [Aequorivita soesokkakensis]OAD90820.1 hypothetical protein A7A78_14005 [Aequorivita soesokkakensis]
MKKIYFFLTYTFVLFCFISNSWGQVGIQSSSPKGALDIGSTTTGLVYPVVSLLDIYNETINNPNGANIIAGTTVYNNNTVDGITGVYPGLYVWNGTVWVPQFEKKDNKLYTQSASVRTDSEPLLPLDGNQTISFPSYTFTPKFTGYYKVLVTVHYGAGRADLPPSSQYVNFVAAEGVFNFTFNSTTSSFTVKAYSGNNDDRLFDNGTRKEYNNKFNQTSFVRQDLLSAGTNYTFSLTFNQASAPGIEGNGNVTVIPAGDGRGYIILNNDLKCTIEFNYVGE